MELKVVAELARRWGTERRAHGYEVWAEVKLATRAEPTHRPGRGGASAVSRRESVPIAYRNSRCPRSRRPRSRQCRREGVAAPGPRQATSTRRSLALAKEESGSRRPLARASAHERNRFESRTQLLLSQPTIPARSFAGGGLALALVSTVGSIGWLLLPPRRSDSSAFEPPTRALVLMSASGALLLLGHGNAAASTGLAALSEVSGTPSGRCDVRPGAGLSSGPLAEQ